MTHDSSTDVAASTRIDPSHSPYLEEPVAPVSPQRRRTRGGAKGTAAGEAALAEAETFRSGDLQAPVFRVDPSEAVPEIVVHHADDIALHLTQRLQEVERRELAAQHYETQLQEAEAAARVWVCQRDLELSALERELQLKSDEVKTQFAAVAAAELSAEQEIRQRHEELRQREAELERRAEQLNEREERLHGERAALDQAMDKLRAERRRDEELHRSRQQKWLALMEADRAQAERTAASLNKHRLALEERERACTAREQARPARDLTSRELRSDHHLELSALRAEAARDHRLALEHRWIAGQLWARLAGSGLAGDDELQDSLENIRGQLEIMYRREQEALEELQLSLAETLRQSLPPPREVKNRSKPRVLAFTG